MLVYVAGFPCKAFSALRTFTDWLDDEQARQFWKVRDTIKELKPPAAKHALCPCSLHEFLPSLFQGLCAGKRDGAEEGVVRSEGGSPSLR